MKPNETAVLARTSHFQKPALAIDARQREGGARSAMVRKLGFVVLVVTILGPLVMTSAFYYPPSGSLWEAM
jgi:hypothetical protein